MISDVARKIISSKFTGQKHIQFTNKIPAVEKIQQNINHFEQIGLYLHIPFCNQICPYCPYNKEVFKPDTVAKYVKATIKEIEQYSALVGNKPITSFYIGGGTPTTMLSNGIEEIIDAIYKRFNMMCSIHMESHPNHLTHESLNAVKTMGVKYLSIGVEAFQDKYLKMLQRHYTVDEVKKKIEMAVSRNFECVNLDYIFDLPGQNELEVSQAISEIVNLGVQQAATYPLFRFPYTKFGKEKMYHRSEFGSLFRRRKHLKVIEDIFYENDFYRSSVWAFTKKKTAKYCSVTVPSYIGIGASGGSYLNDIFYINTFNVSQYIQAMEEDKSPIALSVDLTEKGQMSAWLYWRIYETRFNKNDFHQRFDKDFDEQYGKMMKTFQRLGYLKNGKDKIELTAKGAYWLHAFEDFFSIDYISKLWGTSKTNPWPEQVIL